MNIKSLFVVHHKTARTTEARVTLSIFQSEMHLLSCLTDSDLAGSWLLAARGTSQNMNVDKQMENESKISPSEMPTNTTCLRHFLPQTLLC